MRRNINDVEIVEPPLGEMTRKYSTFSNIKRTCFAGCGCLIVVIIGIIIFLRVALGNGPQTLKQLPDNFPSAIPIYDNDNIDKITFVSGKYKNRGIEIAAFFPKIILSPLLLTMNKNAQSANDTDRLTSVKNLWKIISEPVSDHRDTVQIEWKNLSASPSFIINYYKTELSKNNYKIDVESEGNGVKQFSFSQDSMTGSIYAEGNEEVKSGTDYLVLTINLNATSTTE
ncbi:MAG TPA: hypothetical protein VLK22_00620 [Candidatus Udaeobacter sp.]|nr:hypothetical protein [Candidatus Udaeobacter sp.]